MNIQSLFDRSRNLIYTDAFEISINLDVAKSLKNEGFSPKAIKTVMLLMVENMFDEELKNDAKY